MIRVGRDHDLKVRYHTSMATDKVLHRWTLNKQEELNEAVQWCREKGCEGYKALTAVDYEGKLLVRVSHSQSLTLLSESHTLGVSHSC